MFFCAAVHNKTPKKTTQQNTNLVLHPADCFFASESARVVKKSHSSGRNANKIKCDSNKQRIFLQDLGTH